MRKLLQGVIPLQPLHPQHLQWPDTRRMFWILVLRYVVPMGVLTILDVTGRLHALKVVLLAAPVLDLSNQAVRWHVYVRHFGRPSLHTMAVMLRLDAKRSYRETLRGPRFEEIRRGHAFEYSGLAMGIAVPFYLLWHFLGFSPFLFLGITYLIVALKRPLRLARPPAVVLLGTSSDTTTALQLRIACTIDPLEVVSCALPGEGGGAGFLAFYVYRTSDGADWKAVVEQLVRLAPIVVVDTRVVTHNVAFEADLACAVADTKAVLFLGAPPEVQSSGVRHFVDEQALLSGLAELRTRN